MQRLIFHVDVNSAFLSWEAAKRVKQGLPDLREIPSCIGGDPKKRTEIGRASCRERVLRYRRRSMAFRQASRWVWHFKSVLIWSVSHRILPCMTGVRRHLRVSVHPMRR